MGMHSDIALFSLGDQVCFEQIDSLRADIDRALKDSCGHLVLNCARVQLIDGSGLGFLARLHQRLAAQGGRLSLVNVPVPIMRALNRAGLLDILATTGVIETTKQEVWAAHLDAPTSHVCLRVSKDPAQMVHIREQLARKLQSMLKDADAIFDLTLAFGEALGNAFDHGQSASGDCGVLVTLTNYEDRVVVEVTDEGCGCALASTALPSSAHTRGRGMHIMHMLVDAIDIHPLTHGGTLVRLVKLK